MNGGEAGSGALPPFLTTLPRVRQPSALPTSDPSLATEIMPAPPPIASVLQPQTRQLRAGSAYLPAVDAGSTYTGHAGGALAEGDGKGKRKRRGEGLGANAKSIAINRVQRPRRTATPAGITSSPAPNIAASSSPMGPARSLPPTNIPSSETPIPDLNGHDDLELPPTKKAKLSHKKQDKKGKGKEKEPDPPEQVHTNKDFCEACGGVGEFLCCDGCPRSFHFMCLNPPVDIDDITEDAWYCNACVSKNKPPPPPSKSILGPLIRRVDGDVPSAFRLPDGIRDHFKNVAAGPSGEYVQMGQTRGGRLNKYGAVEERDPLRLKDKNNRPVLCYRCNGSAVPEEASQDDAIPPTARLCNTKGRPIISCDYCNLHWHLDCLEPPLSVLPTNWKKWMCPNHIDHIFPPKRIPAKGVKTVDIKLRNQPNNGIIDVVYADDEMQSMRIDQVVINGKRYRVPEKVIILDFWDAIDATRHGSASTRHGSASTMSTLTSPPASSVPPAPRTPPVASMFSSPLSSLSSIPDEEIPHLPEIMISVAESVAAKATPDREGQEAQARSAAEVLLSLSRDVHSSPPTRSSTLVGSAQGVRQAVGEKPPLPPAVKDEASPSTVPRPLEQDPGTAHQLLLSTARERLQKDLKIALSHNAPSPAGSPKLAPASRAASPAAGITVTPKGNSFTLRLPSLRRPNTGSQPPAEGASGAEEGPVSPEELERLRAVRRLMLVKGEAELLRFLGS